MAECVDCNQTDSQLKEIFPDLSLKSVSRMSSLMASFPSQMPRQSTFSSCKPPGSHPLPPDWCLGWSRPPQPLFPGWSQCVLARGWIVVNALQPNRVAVLPCCSWLTTSPPQLHQLHPGIGALQFLNHWMILRLVWKLESLHPYTRLYIEASAPDLGDCGTVDRGTDMALGRVSTSAPLSLSNHFTTLMNEASVHPADPAVARAPSLLWRLLCTQRCPVCLIRDEVPQTAAENCHVF